MGVIYVDFFCVALQAIEFIIHTPAWYLAHLLDQFCMIPFSVKLIVEDLKHEHFENHVILKLGGSLMILPLVQILGPVLEVVR